MTANQPSYRAPASFVAVVRRDTRSRLGSPGTHRALRGLVRVRWQRSGFDQEVGRVVSGNMRGGLGPGGGDMKKEKETQDWKKAQRSLPVLDAGGVVSWPVLCQCRNCQYVIIQEMSWRAEK